jgi:hypothetical protein
MSEHIDLEGDDSRIVVGTKFEFAFSDDKQLPEQEENSEPTSKPLQKCWIGGNLVPYLLVFYKKDEEIKRAHAMSSVAHLNERMSRAV